MEAHWTYPASVPFRARNDIVLVGGDGHFWPAQRPVMWEAFVRAAHVLKPSLIVLNGDMIDGTRVSRHGRLRRQNAPRVIDEVGAARTRVDELPAKTRVIWTLGNHDTRVDTYLANQAPEMDDFAGSLSDRFPDVTFCYSVVVNRHTIIRHDFRMGIHAAYNNALHSGMSVISNHTHAAAVTAITTPLGRRYGCETGMLNDPNAPQFEYTQNRPSRAWPGFAVLTFDRRGELMMPELCLLAGGRAMFRGSELGHRSA